MLYQSSDITKENKKILIRVILYSNQVEYIE